MKAPVKLVAIDDDPLSLELVSESLSEDGLEIHTSTDPELGFDIILRERPQIVLLDLMMPNVTGMELLERIVQMDPSMDVVLMTAHYSTESAVEAIKKGASDYVNKPLDIPVFRQRIQKLVAGSRRRQRARELDSELLETCQFEGMVGRSPLMWEVFALIQRVAPHFRNCLVTGTTGTGKELVAKALHKLSPVALRPFVVCNSAAVVETLVESELFGHVKGAFTGATYDKTGLFEQANGGVLFLDEIGDMPMATQAKLLRVLQNQEIQRVGSMAVRKVDVRVVAATNYDLRLRISEKLFREDLYYRLSMVELHTPNLVERKEDLPLLESYFIKKFAQQYNKEVTGMTHRAQLVLANHIWPGNVRELENVIGHGCMMAVDGKIDIHDLPQYLRGSAPVTAAPDDQSLDGQERHLLLSALQNAGNNQVQAAKALGISRDRLRYKMKKFNLR